MKYIVTYDELKDDMWTNGHPRLNIQYSIFINGYNYKFIDNILDAVEKYFGMGRIDREYTKNTFMMEDHKVCEIRPVGIEGFYQIMTRQKYLQLRDIIDPYLLDIPEKHE